ncbi:MAG TPA: potassium-transporting ATPase subunit KdpC [Kofleriaceae bacterium]|nr:potassium-transporting ATPase subunit KdpC [Kofleriaceae bacterium]
MKNIVSVALRVTVVTLVLTGIVYPLFMTAAAQVLFPSRAHGSLVENDRGEVIGSRLIGQPFASPAYFQPRPSAAGSGYDAGAASGGSNFGVTSKKLLDRVADTAKQLREANPDAPQGPIPADLLTASGSGLDPHITPAAALWQLPRVARARSIAPERLRAVALDHIEGRALGFIGEPAVNVLELNLALDRQFGAPAALPAPPAPAKHQ